jgi:hypothetical protein
MKKKVVTSMSVMIIDVESDGKKLRNVNYSREEFDDGSIRETGLPAIMPPGASLGDAIAHLIASGGGRK